MIMKRFTVALVALSTVLVGPVPSYAEEPMPIECEGPVQAWRERALAAEARAEVMRVDLHFEQSANLELEGKVATLEARLGFTERLLVDAKADIVEHQQRFYRQYNKIWRQRLTIARLRERLAETRGDL